jgi:hypothetical protein
VLEGGSVFSFSILWCRTTSETIIHHWTCC